MLYDYQYDIAAVIVTLMLLLVYFLRHGYRISSSHLFLHIVILNLIASAADVLCAFTISYPERYSYLTDCLSNATYLLTYNAEALFFLLFVSAIIDDPKKRRIISILCSVVFAMEALVIFTSPFTRLVFYYDENLVYSHGPVLTMFYVVSVVTILLAVVIMGRNRNRLNSYQIISLAAFVCGMAACVLFQMKYPRYVIGNLVAGSILVFIYIVFENPAQYMYGSTFCYNRSAFLDTVRRLQEDRTPFSVVAFRYTDYSYTLHMTGKEKMDAFSYSVADKLRNMYRKNAFGINYSTFAVICPTDTLQKKKTAEEIENSFGSCQSVFICAVDSVDVPDPYSNLQDVIEYMLSTHCRTISSGQISKVVIEQKKRHELIEHILSQAIDDNLFDVYYQPIYDTRAGRYAYAEALVRLQNTEHGFIGPDEFIPVAESNGMILKIGEIVLDKVCRFIASGSFSESGFEYIAVNLSGIQCIQEKFADSVSRIIDSYGISYKQLNFEITETSEISWSSSLMENMRNLTEKGSEFSVDDFGSGFSTGEYLYRMPVSIVKIDKGVLWEAMKDSHAMIVLESTIGMVRKLDKKVVVEGVENKEMVDILMKNSCDYMQGYYFSKPVKETDIASVVQSLSL